MLPAAACAPNINSVFMYLLLCWGEGGRTAPRCFWELISALPCRLLQQMPPNRDVSQIENWQGCMDPTFPTFNCRCNESVVDPGGVLRQVAYDTAITTHNMGSGSSFNPPSSTDDFLDTVAGTCITMPAASPATTDTPAGRYTGEVGSTGMGEGGSKGMGEGGSKGMGKGGSKGMGEGGSGSKGRGRKGESGQMTASFAAKGKGYEPKFLNHPMRTSPVTCYASRRSVPTCWNQLPRREASVPWLVSSPSSLAPRSLPFAAQGSVRSNPRPMSPPPSSVRSRLRLRTTSEAPLTASAVTTFRVN